MFIETLFARAAITTNFGIAWGKLAFQALVVILILTVLIVALRS